MTELKLFDHNGRVVNLEALQSERGRPEIASVRTIWQPWVAPGLTPQRLAEILQEAVQGNHNQAMTLAMEMEERDPHYQSVLATRKLAVSAIEPTVEAPPKATPLEQEMTADLRELLAEPEFGDVIPAMMDAVGKGFSCTEILWERRASKYRPIRYEWRDPRFFRFDRPTMQHPRLLGADDPVFGVPLEPFKWIVHDPKLKMGIPIRGGLARLVAACFICKSYVLKDWLAFCEVFGLPVRVGKYSPAADEEDINLLINAVANIGTDAAAVVPSTMQIDFQESTSANGGGLLFQGLTKYLDQLVSKATLGQTSSVDEGATGMGGGQRSKMHQGVKNDIRDDDAAKCARTITRDLGRAYLTLNYGVQPRYPTVRLKEPEAEDLSAFSTSIAPLIDRGLPVAAAPILAKYGLELPAAGELVLRPLAKGAPPSPDEPSDDDPDTNRSQLPAPPVDDAIDRIRNEALADWEPQLDDVLAPIRKLIDDAQTKEELLAAVDALKHASMSQHAFEQGLTLALFKARVIGGA